MTMKGDLCLVFNLDTPLKLRTIINDRNLGSKTTNDNKIHLFTRLSGNFIFKELQ